MLRNKSFCNYETDLISSLGWRAAHQDGEAEPGGLGWVRTPGQDPGFRGPAEGGDEDQPVAVCSRQRHQRPRRRKVQTHSLQRFKADEITAGEIPEFVSLTICCYHH